MKKWIKATLAGVALLSILILACIPGAIARAKSVSDFVANGTVLRSYKGTGDTCVIPSDITEIGPEAFRECSLKSITIPDTVKKIDKMAFYGCKKLERVAIEEGVAYIGVSAFASCPKLTSVMIPASVTDICAGAFSGCTSLSSVEIASGNKNYFYNDGVLYNKASTELVQYLPGRRSTTYEIPFTVKRIDRYAFWGASLLTDVRLSNNVKEIPDHAFSNCTGLTHVYLPESVKRIGAYGFSDCVNLTYVAMESSDVKISETAFSGCGENLKTDNGVTEESARESSGYNLISPSGSDSADGAEGDDGVSEDGNSSDSGGAKKEQKPHQKTFTVKTVLPSEIDTGGEDVVGAGRISGGEALIIPKK